MHPDCGWPEQFRRLRRRALWAALWASVVSIPVLVFALVGLPHVFRTPLVRNVMSEGTGPGSSMPALTADNPDFASTFELLSGATLTSGNSVQVLANGDETFAPLWRDLRAARRSVTVQMYYVGPGSVVETTVAILAQRAREGVHVYFLYDAFGAKALPPALLETLRAAGVRATEFRPLRWYALDRANHRSHVRGIVIDGEIAYTGGFGLDDKWLGGGRRRTEWRETNARFTGPAVAQLQAAFVAKWAEAAGTLLADTRLLASHNTATDSANVRVDAGLVYSPPLTGSTTAERLLALSIATARQRLYITNAYFVPQADFVRLLTEAARRGVDVRILTNGPRSDVRTTWLAGRSRYEPLLAAGVRIWEYRPTTVHAKTLVSDGTWSLISTMNFDNRSLAYNNEAALVARDRRVGAVLDSLFLEDLRFADEIRPEVFARRVWITRWLERAASLVAPVL